MKSSPIVLGLCALILLFQITVRAQEKPVVPANSGAPQDIKGAITGTVSDQTGVGVGGAIVSVDNGAGLSSSGTTDDQGLYALTDLAAGPYTVSVTLRGSRIFQGKVVLSASQVLTLSVAGVPVAASGGTGSPAPTAVSNSKGAITGTVSDPKGTGLGGAVVTADNGAGSTATATTDDQGLYALTDLAAGSYAVAVKVHGEKIFQANLALNSGQVLTLSAAGAPVAQPDVASAPAAAAQLVPAQAAASSSSPSSQSTSSSAPVQYSRIPVLEIPGPRIPILADGSGLGSITGSISDQTGAVVVGATVKIKDGAGKIQTAVSDDKGNYLVQHLALGSYSIAVTAPGFKAFQADNVILATAQQLPLDAALEPGGEKTEVNVEAQKVAEVETENAEVSGTITQKEVVSLGLNGRNFTQLIALTPGVSNQTGQDEAKVGVTGSVKYSVNGGRVEYNTFEVDGTDVLNAGLNGAESTLIVYPSLDAIQEVKVLTSNYGAMYGRTASGTVIVSSKSGGAQFHGNGYEFIRNEAFNARNYFDQTTKAPLYRRNDFGYTLGGPLFIPQRYNTKKDKTFFFWSQEFRFEKSPTDQQPDFNRAVPSLAERKGDFNDVCPPYNAPSAFPNEFTHTQYPDCPSGGPGRDTGYLQLFVNNRIPGSNQGALDPNALALLNTNLIPLPNSSTGCNSPIGSCYDAVISEPTSWREELLTLDHNFNSRVRLSFHYIHDAWNTTVPVPQWQRLPGDVVNSFPTVQNKFVGPGVVLSANLTQTLSSTLLNQFTVSFVNAHITLSNVNGPGGANYQRPSGLGQPGGPCVTLPVTGSPSCPIGAIFNNGFGGKAPGIIIAGNNLEYGGNGFTADTSYMPWEHTNPTYSYRDVVSKAIKSHTLQFGAQVVFFQRNQTSEGTAATPGDIQGLLTFSNINGGPSNTGNAFANFLTMFEPDLNNNNIQSYTQDSAQSRYYNRYHLGEPFIQDDWKVNRRLTVNLGVRFSLFGVYHEKYLREYNWDPSAYSPALAAQLRVDPVTGELISRPDQTPIPINVSNPDPRIMNGLVQCGVNYVPAGCMKGHVFNPAPRVGFALDPFGDGKTSIRAGYGMFFEHGTGDEANTGSLEASAPFVLSMTQPFPHNYGCIGGSSGIGCQPSAYPLNLTAIPTQAVWPYAQQWSFSIQRELPKSLVANIAYVGSKGTHLTAERQLNQIKPLPANLNPFGINEPLVPQAPANGVVKAKGDCGGFTGIAGAPGVFNLLNGTTIGPQDPAYINLEAACAGESGIAQGNALSVPPNVNTLRPYPGLGDIFSLQNVADSSYNGLQFTMRRTKGPLTMGGSYTWSHSFDDSSDRSDATFVNSYDLRSNRASSNFDQRHLLNISYVYDFPKLSAILQNLTSGTAGEPTGDGDEPLPGSPSKILHVLGDGWELSGIAVFQSGTPFSVINGGSTTISVLDNAGVANGVGVGSYPDVVGDPHAAPPVAGNNPRSFGPLLGNPNAFAAPRGLTFGNAGRNFLNNPSRLNFDMSLLKHFPIGDSSALEFRAEAFNVFNHTQFRIYDPNLGNTGANVISCYGGPNYTAGFSNAGIISANPVGGADCLTGSAFLHPVNAHRPRTIQFGLKYSF